jgi:hypothetical protein
MSHRNWVIRIDVVKMILFGCMQDESMQIECMRAQGGFPLCEMQ